MGLSEGGESPYGSDNSQPGKKPLRILMVAGVYPTAQKPHAGTFIKAQADSLVAADLEVEVIYPKPGPRPGSLCLGDLTGLLEDTHRAF